MRKIGYSVIVGAGLLLSSLVAAQETSSQGAASSQAAPSAQPQAGCCCGMMGGGMGGMMGQDMGGAGMACPMHGMANVQVEQTPTGAVLRLTAKNPAQVSEVQRMAQMMENCMSGSGAQQSPPSARPPAQRQP